MTSGPSRRYPRVKSPKELRVAWQAGAKKAVSSLETLALGGLFIRTPEPPTVGTSVQLLIDMPEGEVRARAVVRSVESGRGMGVEIVSMRQEDRARLDKFLKPLLPGK